MSDTEHQLRRQAEAARDLLTALRGDGYGDDAELIDDAIDGQTDIKEAIAAAIDEIDEAEVLILGGEAKIEQIASRVAMEKKRVERIRASIERAILTAELPTPIKLATGTVSISRRAPGVVVVDEAAIPSRFFVVPPAPPPKLDKKALAAALKANETVPGAMLDNGTISLVVRRT